MRKGTALLAGAAGAAVLAMPTGASAGSLPPPPPSPLVAVVLNIHNGQTTGRRPNLVGFCTAKAPSASIADMRLFIDYSLVAHGGTPLSTRVSTIRYVPRKLASGKHVFSVQCWDSTPERNLTAVSVTFKVRRACSGRRPHGA